MSVKITVEGADRLARTLQKAADDLADWTPVHGKVARMIAAATQPPSRSGALKASIRGTGTATEAVVGSSLVYAPVIEFGWPRRNIRPRRFLTSAFDSHRDQAVSMYSDAVADTIGHVKGA
ncbi:MAG TPA: hypothetical protein VKB57_16490 [Acidimicrobiales bacterium]|nr:hypothetical protein [Acidimicrobiales bacterium]